MATSKERDWIMEVIALYDYEPEEWDELRIFEGDILRVLRVQDDGWWCGYLADEPENIGVFPSNYVQTQHIPHSDHHSDLNPRKPATVRNYSKASVLQLKRSLAEAEKANEEAQRARKNAEKTQLQRIILHSHSRIRGDANNGGNNQKESAAPNVATTLLGGDIRKGTLVLPPEKAHLMEKIILIYKARKQKEKKNTAAQKIYYAYRSYMARMLEKQHTAATRIIRFIKKNMQNGKAAYIQKWYRRCKSIRARQTAAIRIQRWIRPFLLYFQWKRKVEEIRTLMAKERKQKGKRDEKEKKEQNHEKLRKSREKIKTNAEKQAKYLDKSIDNQLQDRTGLTLSHVEVLDSMENAQKALKSQVKQQQHGHAETTKIKCEVIVPCKKEVEKTVRDLVKIQLDKRLRKHDEKIRELQLLVTKLHDVICKQNDIITQSFDLDHDAREKKMTLLPVLDALNLPTNTPSGIKPPRATNSLPKIKLPILN